MPAPQPAQQRGEFPRLRACIAQLLPRPFTQIAAVGANGIDLVREHGAVHAS